MCDELLTACSLRTIPVTVNWQADETNRVLYKAEITESPLAIVDSGVSKALIEALEEQKVTVFDVSGLSAATALDPAEFDASVVTSDTRMVIFTSGTTGNPKGAKARSFECMIG